jgi:predicted Zn-dependent peptidase
LPQDKSPARPKIVFVDRADAPQAVVELIKPSVAANDPRYAPLYRANIALGGSFTSRLMQDLREEHGWTYGAGSRVGADRGIGMFSAFGSFITEKCVDALGATLIDLDKIAHAGLTEDEVAKTRSYARSEIVDEYATVAHTSFALAHDAALGLGSDYEARSSVLSDGATQSDLNKLAATFFDPAGGTVVVVGPRAKLEGPLTQAGYGPIEYRDAEGRLLGEDKSAKSAKSAKEPK